MNIINKNYSLWLIPEGKTYHFLKTLIEKMAKKYKSSVFEPHIGLLHKTEESADEISTKMLLLTKQISTFMVTLNKLTYFDKNPGGLFFTIKRNAYLNKTIEQLKKTFSYEEKPYKIQSHLTITYALLKQLEKKSNKKFFKNKKNHI